MASYSATPSASATLFAAPSRNSTASSSPSASGTALPTRTPSPSLPHQPSATASSSLSASSTRSYTITLTGTRSRTRTPSPSGSAGAPASASPLPAPVAQLELTLPWCAPGALSSDGALGPSLRAGLAQAAAGVPASAVAFTSAVCLGRRGRALGAEDKLATFDPATGVASGGSRNIVAGISMRLSVTVASVDEFTSKAGDLIASNQKPNNSPGDFFVGGPPDPALAGMPALLEVSSLSALLLAQEVGGAMGCGASGGGAPGAGVSAQLLSPLGPFFAAFSAASALSPASALSCDKGALRITMVTPQAPPPAHASTLGTAEVVVISVLVPIGACALLAGTVLLWQLRASRRAAGSPLHSPKPLIHPPLPGGATFGERRTQPTPTVVVRAPVALAGTAAAAAASATAAAAEATALSAAERAAAARREAQRLSSVALAPQRAPLHSIKFGLTPQQRGESLLPRSASSSPKREKGVWAQSDPMRDHRGVFDALHNPLTPGVAAVQMPRLQHSRGGSAQEGTTSPGAPVPDLRVSFQSRRVPAPLPGQTPPKVQPRSQPRMLPVELD